MSWFFKGPGKGAAPPPHSPAREVYDNVSQAKNIHDTASHETHATTLPGAMLDYASKFAVGSRLPLFTPDFIASPIEAARQAVVARVAPVFESAAFKQKREDAVHAHAMAQFQAQKMADWQRMPEWQKREMGYAYHQGASALEDEHLARRQAAFKADHEYSMWEMGYGRPPGGVK